MNFQTNVTDLLGIEYPIIQGGLAYLAYSDLCAAVSNAGGLGQVTAMSLKTPEELREEIKKVRELTGGANPMAPGASNGSLMFVTFDPETEEFAKVKENVMKEIEEFEVKGEWKSQDFSTSGSSNQISYFVYGKNKEAIQPVVEDIAAIMEDEKDLKDVDTSLSKSYTEYTFVVDKEKLTQYGLTTAQIGMKLNPNVQREVLTTITKDEQTVDVYIDQQKEIC